jgi:hypothetical protein
MMKTINEHDRVVLTAPFPAEGLEAGDVGVVVHIYPDARAYEVEFTTLTGRTAAVVTLPADGVRPVDAGEITHARRLAAGA